jgi:hypothetical protein
MEETCVMSEDLSRLHKILKDGTRVKILELLNNRDSLSYSELLLQSGITNTGRLNYHLKILGDLVTKDQETGKYSLSEKGKLALEFLQKLHATSMGKESGFHYLQIPSTPFGRGARTLQGILGLEILLIILVNLYAYFTLPSLIPLHYEFDGQVLSTAPKYIFLLFAILLNIPQTVFLLLSVSRNYLASSPFSTINFPSFHLRLPKINYEKRGYWVNKYFAPILAFGAVVGTAMFFLNLAIYESVLSSNSLSPLYIIGTIVVIAVGVVALLIYMRSYVQKLDTDSG